MLKQVLFLTTAFAIAAAIPAGANAAVSNVKPAVVAGKATLVADSGKTDTSKAKPKKKSTKKKTAKKKPASS